MSNTLRSRLQEDMKSAMRAKETLRLTTIRMLIAAIKQREIDEKIESLDDMQVLEAVNKMIKQRRDSFKQFEEAGRKELAEKEQQEIDILITYLPKQLSDEEITIAIDTAIQKTGAESMKDMGKIMGILKPELTGKADMSAVSKLVKQRLGE